MGTAEDDDQSRRRSSAGSTGTDDALDDAADVRVPLFVAAQWSGSILGDFDNNPDYNAVFQYRLGRAYFAFPRRWYQR